MRFSLLNLLVVMGLASLYLGVVFGLPSFFSVPVLGLAMLCIPSLSAAGIVYSRGWHRAFWIGCIGPALPLWLVTAYYLIFLAFEYFDGLDDQEVYYIKYVVFGFHVACVLGGLSAVALRWLYSRPKDRKAENA